MASGGLLLPAVTAIGLAGGLALFRLRGALAPPAARFTPPPPGPVVPADAGLDARFRAVAYPAADGVLLTAWRAPVSGTGRRPTVLLLADAGEGLAALAGPATTLADAGYGVFLTARRPGPQMPGVGGLLADVRAALDHLTGEGVSGSRLVLHSRGLAAALAAQMALERPPAALILQSPAEAEGGLGVRDRLAGLAADCRLLVLHGIADRRTPVALARRILAAARNRPGGAVPPPQGVWLDGVGADDLWRRGGAAAALAFLAGGGSDGPVLDVPPAPPGTGGRGLPVRQGPGAGADRGKAESP